MSLINRIRNKPELDERQRFSLEALMSQVNYLGHSYPPGS
jgi:hypothetical protein